MKGVDLHLIAGVVEAGAVGDRVSAKGKQDSFRPHRHEDESVQEEWVECRRRIGKRISPHVVRQHGIQQQRLPPGPICELGIRLVVQLAAGEETEPKSRGVCGTAVAGAGYRDSSGCRKLAPCESFRLEGPDFRRPGAISLR